MADLEIFDDGDELFVDSRLIAERLGIEHRSFLETVDTYEEQIEQAFGVLRFQTAKPLLGSQGGRPQNYVFLNEDQASFLMTLSRNTPEVVQCKIDLVQAFSKAKELLKQRYEKADKRLSYWYQRIQIALSDGNLPIQTSYFCAYLQMMNFFQELEVRLGYVLPDLNPETEEYLVPDISIASRFNDWLRSDVEGARLKRKEFLGSEQPIDFRPLRQNKDKVTKKKVWVKAGTHHHEIRMYNHVYPEASHGDNQVQQARSYPNKYIPIFLYYLEEIWIPECFKVYLSPRSPEGWTQIEASLRKLSPREKYALRGTLVGKLLPLLPPGEV